MGWQIWIIAFLMFNVVFSHPAPPPEVNPATTGLTYITLEEHYDSPSVWSYQKEIGVYDILIDALGGAGAYNPTLRNLSVRIPDMDKHNIKMQVLGNDPQPYVLLRPDVARAANNEMAKAISQYPDRFRGFCFLPMALPKEAADELSRCVTQLGFLGALVDSHLLNQTFYDGEEYDVLWDMFEKLDVPLYLHPTYPQTPTVNKTGGIFAPDDDSFSEGAASVLGTAGWAWHSECGIAFTRMWLGGVFDKHPKFKMIMGHMGDMVPYMLHRINYTLGPTKPTGLTVLEAYAQSIWITTSGFFSLAPFRALWDITATERIMYSVDYPWAKNSNGAEFMKKLKDSGIVSEDEWKKIAYENAEGLLRIS